MNSCTLTTWSRAGCILALILFAACRTPGPRDKTNEAMATYPRQDIIRAVQAFDCSQQVAWQFADMILTFIEPGDRSSITVLRRDLLTAKVAPMSNDGIAEIEKRILLAVGRMLQEEILKTHPRILTSQK